MILAGDGVTNTYELSFTMEYLRKRHVSCRVGMERDSQGNPIYRDLTWPDPGNPNLVKIEGDVPAAGQRIVFFRIVPKDFIMHVFQNNNPFTALSFDEDYVQLMHAIHEILDQFEFFKQEILDIIQQLVEEKLAEIFKNMKVVVIIIPMGQPARASYDWPTNTMTFWLNAAQIELSDNYKGTRSTVAASEKAVGDLYRSLSPGAFDGTYSDALDGTRRASQRVAASEWALAQVRSGAQIPVYGTLMMYIDPVNGNDNNDGLTRTTAVKTIIAGHNLLNRYRVNEAGPSGDTNNIQLNFMPGVTPIPSWFNWRSGKQPMGHRGANQSGIRLYFEPGASTTGGLEIICSDLVLRNPNIGGGVTVRDFSDVRLEIVDNGSATIGPLYVVCSKWDMPGGVHFYNTATDLRFFIEAHEGAYVQLGDLYSCTFGPNKNCDALMLVRSMSAIQLSGSRESDTTSLKNVVTGASYMYDSGGRILRGQEYINNIPWYGFDINELVATRMGTTPGVKQVPDLQDIIPA